MKIPPCKNCGKSLEQPCKNCGKSFEQVKRKIEHEKACRSINGKVCEKEFKLEKTMKLHYIGQHTEKFKCKECGKSFENESRLKRHQNIHTKSAAFKCNECGKKFTRTENLNKHLKGSH